MTSPKHNLATPAHGEVAQARKSAPPAFSLIEVLIAVTLLSIIVIGLMAMFGETQRAFRTGINQVDIMEGGRSALEIMAREVEQATATGLPLAANFSVTRDPSITPYRLIQTLPSATTPLPERVNILQDVLFTSRQGQNWSGIGYSVYFTNWIGSLYRYETNASELDSGDVAELLNRVLKARPSKVMDNVLSLRVHTYDNLGRLISPNYNYLNYPSVPTLNTNWVAPRLGSPDDDILVSFYSNALPAYVEIELGILEAKTADRARAIGEDSLSQQELFLQRQAGKVQVFRQRIPIRNVDPSVYQ